MEIKFNSTVLIVKDLSSMKSFYKDLLKLDVEVDFGNCIGFKSGFSLWKLTEDYPISKKLGRTFDDAGNKNLELCFETEDFNEVEKTLKNYNLNYLHKTTEETWGQKTIRLYDPENNLIEIGETVPCFVKRFYHQGMSTQEVSERTSVPIDWVNRICAE
ncbi:hypothetical protein OAA06_01375 [bacterium]|nr:hypothetical protein [bacterium]